MNSITLKDLKLSYDEHIVVNGLNLCILEGKVTSLIGPNGCGKSTILKAAGRILKPQKGAVLLNGDDIRSLPTREVAKRMSILPQTPAAPSGLTVRELVSYGRFPHQEGVGRQKKEDEAIIEWALDITRLSDVETAEVDKLSGGQRQRVWIAMALAQQSSLILLDEPTTYLDMAYQLEVLELLEKLNRERGSTIIMVLHDLNLASRFSDFLVAIREGCIIAQGTPEEIMTPRVLRDTFYIDAEITADLRTGRPVCNSYHLI
ncbi:ABC transporter ATP-binding protein [Lacrimispora amygdalina]|uniref:ABC transporter ATP-binding protein n=1 Tax=Lacrimispora amygdalina TaxID=253257 RepID=UPI000BE3DEB3|nr:ABC transporter ATP-binding protein [Lacrimispora amygdalina]